MSSASSPGELEPVFQAMLANATRICEAKFGTLWLREGDAFRAVALHNAPPAYAEARRRELRLRPRLTAALGRATSTKQVVQIDDITAHDLPIRTGSLRLNSATIATVVCRADAQGRRTYRRDQHFPPRGASIHRQAGRSAAATSPPRPSSPSRTPACSTSCAKSLGAADRDRGGAQGHQRSPASWSRCSRRCWQTRRGFAKPRSAHVAG